MPTLTRLIIAFLVLLLTPACILAHSGGLDKSGGHYNRKTGEYHHHGKKSETSPQQSPSLSISAKQLAPTTTSGIEARINSYFRSANENVGALNCGLVKYERNVDEATKLAVKGRDGNRCVICQSTVKLEVDHRRALMNGGTNDIDNLATLCDDCHKIKTRMDSSLRRKREKICR